MIRKISVLVLSMLLAFGIQAQTSIGTIEGEAYFDYSGRTVSMNADGTIVAIGTNSNDGNGDRSGHVRIFENINGTWTQIGSDIDGEAAGDYSGISISLNDDGTIVAIGADQNDGNGDRAGHVRIFENINDTWTQVGNDIDGEAAEDFSGCAVSLSADGSIVAVGAYGSGDFVGHVRIFKNVNDTWTQIGSDIDGEAPDDYSGWAISLNNDGSIIAIGAAYNDGNGDNSGHVRVYENQNDAWVQIGDDIDGEAAGDISGKSVSINGDGSIVAIGAPRNDGNGDNSGHVRVFKNENGAWVQLGESIDGVSARESSGWSISLSNSGYRLAVGAPYNSENATESGQVRIYDYRSYNGDYGWRQSSSDLSGQQLSGGLGVAVSLSSYGTTLAVGEPGYDGTELRIGQVYLYSLQKQYQPIILEESFYVKYYGDDFTVSAVACYSGNPVIFSSSNENIAICSGQNGETIKIVGVGHCRIEATVAGNDEFYIGGRNFNLSTRKKPITVTVDANQSKIYGDQNPTEYTYTSTALIGTDEFSGALTRATGEDVGTYAISQNTLTAGANYEITFTGNDFEITPYPVTVTVDANQSKIYGEQDPEFTYTATDLLNSDEYSGSLSRDAGNDVGTYSILQNDLTAGGNYDIAFSSNDFEITVCPLNVTVDANQSKVYGEQDPVFAYTSDPLHYTDEFSGTLSRETGENAGTYAILQNDLTVGDNYDINFTGDDFEITKANPIISWNSPADIDEGTALSETQLNATSDVDGGFEYTPAIGTVLSAGNNQQLSTVFTPTDAVNYNTANTSVYINVLAVVGISDLSIISSIYPNPTKGIVNFKFTENNIQKITISDITGKQIIEKTGMQQNEQIDLSGFDSGIYIISIQTDNEIFSTKIIKE